MPYRSLLRYALYRFLAICLLTIGGLWLFTAPLAAQTQTPTRTPSPTRTPTRTPVPTHTLVPIEIFLPVVSSTQNQTANIVAGEPIDTIEGVIGQLHSADERNFGTYLLTDDNLTYGLVGANVALEQGIISLRDQQPPSTVIVWGTSYRIIGAEDIPVIVVDKIQTANATPVAVTATTLVATMKFDLVNLRAGPANSYARTGQVLRSQRCTVIGRNRSGAWVQLACNEDVGGWIDRRLVDLNGDVTTLTITEPTIIVVITPTATTTPTATATRVVPTATPVPPPSAVWRASYFNNRNLQGTPVVVQEVAAINFSWSTNPPVAELPADNFSARFERVVNFNDGFYRFSVSVDDGVRFWIDNELLIDEWHGTDNRTYSVGRNLRGLHTLTLDYYEASGLASLRFLIEFTTAFPEWEAAYFNGVNPSGSPVFSQLEARATNPLDYDWATSSPLPDRLNADNWSARWSGQFRFSYATYVFRAMADDGVRVYIDDQLVIDGWRDGYKDLTNRFYAVGAGIHTIRVEYYERTGSASLRVWWYEDSTNSPR